MSELKPCLMESDLNLLNDRILNLGAGLATMPENGTMQVNKAFLTAIMGYMEELLGVRRVQPANEPLTLEQLREMEWYEPVYVKFKHAIPSKVVSNLYDCLCYIGASESNYGKTWLAYRRPPEIFIGVDLASGHDFTAYGRPPEGSENDGQTI